MAQIHTTYQLILSRIVARLIDQITELSDANCFMNLTGGGVPLNTFSTNHRAAVVHPSGGSYDTGEQDGAGALGCRLNISTDVTIWASKLQDQEGRDVHFLTDETKGVLELARLATKALVGHHLKNSGGDTITDVPIQIEAIALPQKDEKFGSVTLTFMTHFHLDLDT